MPYNMPNNNGLFIGKIGHLPYKQSKSHYLLNFNPIGILYSGGIDDISETFLKYFT